jgi:hypothetical protein
MHHALRRIEQTPEGGHVSGNTKCPVAPKAGRKSSGRKSSGDEMIYLICENRDGDTITKADYLPVDDATKLFDLARFWQPNYDRFFHLECPPGHALNCSEIYLRPSRLARLMADYRQFKAGNSRDDRRWGRYFIAEDRHS